MAGIKRYVEQLLGDLGEAKGKAEENLFLFFDNAGSYEYLTISDDEEGGIKLSELVGMEKFLFPQLEYLNFLEARMLTDALIHVYRAYGFNPLFLHNVPYKIKYAQLRDYMSNIVYPCQEQLVDIEMCDYLPRYCPFVKICPVACESGQCCEHRKKTA